MNDHDKAHQVLKDLLTSMSLKMILLEGELMTLKDAFYQHTHEDDRPFEVNHGHEP